MKIEGYFNSIKDANRAVERLKSAGYKKVYSVVNDHYSDEPNYWDNSGFDNGYPISNAVINPSIYAIGGGPGFSPIGFSGAIIGGINAFGRGTDVKEGNYKVIVEAESIEEEKVKQMMYELGGELKDPNFRRNGAGIKSSLDRDLE